jgi:hypothetical protein
VLARVRTHLRIRQLDQQVKRRNADLEHELSVAQELIREARNRTDGVLVGESAVARRLRQDIADAAASDMRCSSAGRPAANTRRSLARRIISPRAARAPIICVSCLQTTSADR